MQRANTRHIQQAKENYTRGASVRAREKYNRGVIEYKKPFKKDRRYNENLMKNH